MNKENTNEEEWKKCTCGEEKTIGDADVEIGGVCHRVNNPCYVIVPPEEKLRELIFPNADYDVSELVKEGISSHNARLIERLTFYDKKPVDSLYDGIRWEMQQEVLKILKESNLQE